MIPESDYGASTIMQKGCKTLLVLGMVMLLAIQLTGLNCLSDYANHEYSSELVFVHDQLPNQANAPASFTDDGCPCHLTFQTARSAPLSVMSPFNSMPPDGFLAFTPNFVPFVFHPPAHV